MVYVWMWLILTGALITAGPDIPDPCKTPEHAEDPNIFSISLICIARVGAIFVRAYKTLHKLGGGGADMGQRARCLAINILSHILAMPQNRRQRVAPGFGALPLSISRRMRSHTYRLQCMTYACKIAMYNLSKPLQQHAAALAPGGGRHRRRLLCRIHLARSRKSLLKRRVTQSGAAQM